MLGQRSGRDQPAGVKKKVRLQLLVELAYWENDLKLGQRRQHDYNCGWCERRGLWNRPGKGCFKHYDTRFIPPSEPTERGFTIRRGELEVTADQVVEQIGKLASAQPDRSAFDICRMLRICPTGLLDQGDWDLLALEGAVREYGAGYFSAAGLDPPPAVTLDAMQAIRGARNAVEARRWKQQREQRG